MYFNASTFMASYLHQFYALVEKRYFWDNFTLYNKFSIIIKRIDVATAPSKDAIWDEFSQYNDF